MVSAGLTFGDPAAIGWFGGIKARYFGPRPLIEDNSVRSKSSSPVSARLGILSDGTPVGTATDDIHFHPLEPRSVRLSVAKQW